MKKIIYFLILFLLFGLSVNAESRIERNLVNIYFFHSDNCSHCKKELKLLKELEEEYSNIKIYSYEINDKKSNRLFNDITRLLEVNGSNVPFTIIGGKYYRGFSEINGKKTFVSTIEYYSRYGYKDVVGEYIGDIELPSFEIDENAISLKDFIEDYGNYTLFGNVQTNNLSLPIITLLMSLLDSFNLINIFILIFLICVLLNINDDKKRFIIGIIFLCLVYFVSFLLDYIFGLFFIKILFCISIIGYGLYNLTILFKKKKVECNVINIFIIILLFMFSIMIIYNKKFDDYMYILYLNDLSRILEIVYIVLYAFLYVLSSIIVFVIIFILLKLFNLLNKRLIIILGNFMLILLGALFLLIYL